MADETEDKAEEAPKKGSKKLLIIGLLLGLLLGGGAGAGALMMMGGGGAEHVEEKDHKEAVVEEPKTDHQFVKLERMTLPLVKNNKVLGQMMIDFSLEVDGTENKMTVIRKLPEIRDAILRHYSDTPLGKADSPRSVDYPKLKKTLKKISNKLLHEPLVTRVMVVQVRQF